MAKAQRIMKGATFDPNQLEMAADLFEEVWASVAPDYAASEIENARMRLATVVLDLARDGQLGALQITRTASRLMREAGARDKKRSALAAYRNSTGDPCLIWRPAWRGQISTFAS
jgi:hypothetical protein